MKRALPIAMHRHCSALLVSHIHIQYNVVFQVSDNILLAATLTSTCAHIRNYEMSQVLTSF